eukprot:SAG11_NODE_463_length_9226_cov_21.629232_7_plen_231_part_00
MDAEQQVELWCLVPSDLLHQVFRLLSSADLRAAARVCRGWRSAEGAGEGRLWFQHGFSRFRGKHAAMVAPALHSELLMQLALMSRGFEQALPTAKFRAMRGCFSAGTPAASSLPVAAAHAAAPYWKWRCGAFARSLAHDPLGGAVLELWKLDCVAAAAAATLDQSGWAAIHRERGAQRRSGRYRHPVPHTRCGAVVCTAAGVSVRTHMPYRCAAVDSNVLARVSGANADA